ncbi:MAG: hypothetical protein Q9P44_07155 [Anaerolineae bacterium]|nr:hypothetical protein [Anaerolineae bacterium]
MKRFALITLLLILSTLPLHAQANLGATYTLDTGTSIDYPQNWSAEIQDNLVVLSQSDISRAIIIDYPLVSQLIASDQTLADAVSVVADQVFGGDYDADLIAPFTILGRNAARYDIAESPTASSGSIVAVRFSNERIGIIIAINVNNSIFNQMLESFDNTSPANDNAFIPSGGSTVPATESDTYFYQAGGRLIVPIGWTVVPRMVNNEIEYVTLQTADTSTTALAFDLSNVLGNSIILDRVVAASGLNLQGEFGVAFNIETGEFIRSDNRIAYRYPVTVNGQAGQMIAVHFDDGGTGLFIVYGNTRSYTSDIHLILGSFNNLGSLLNYLQ